MAAHINDDETVPDPRHAQLFFKLALILLCEHDLLWSGQLHPIFRGAFQPRPQSAVERQLPQVDIKRRHALSGVAQRDARVKRRRRFTHAAFFIGKNNDVPFGG